MKLNVFDIKNAVLEKGLTVYQRGLIITILVLKESDPKMTLAKLRASINMNEAKEALVDLHERKMITWSGYNSAKKSLAKKKSNPKIVEIINFMNNLYNRKFDPKSGATVTALQNRLEKYSVDDIKRVISNRYIVWKNEPVMHIHLNPTTIFRARNFDKYFEEAISTRVGESITEAHSIDLEHGDELTYKVINSLVDVEIYNVKAYGVASNGKRGGVGVNMKIKGSDLKKRINREMKVEKRDGVRNNIYLYQTK